MKQDGKVEFERELVELIPIGLERMNGSLAYINSSTSVNNESRFLDEIALLKRGKITRDTPKNRCSVRQGSDTPMIMDNNEAISLAELTSRGLRLADGTVIYGLPQLQNAALNPQGSTTDVSISNTSMSSSTSGKPSSQASTNNSLIVPATNEKSFRVGHCAENARLTVSEIKDGKRFELNINDKKNIVLQRTKKTTLLMTMRE